MDCIICLDEVDINYGISCGDCRRYYHYDCLKKWVNIHKTCPHCRSKYDTSCFELTETIINSINNINKLEKQLNNYL